MKTAIDQYLAGVAPDQRVALEKLRKTIRAAAPKAEEYIGYGLAAFRLGGKPLVAFGASKRHCAFCPMNGTSVEAHKGELESYETSKGMIRFQPQRPLPAALVRKIVKERIAEVEEGKPRNPGRRIMKKSGNGADPIAAYSQARSSPLRAICDRLRELIDAALPGATSKVWHGSPVWSMDDNPVAGYNATAKGVNLLFWNGRAFDEKALKPVGKYRAAQAMFGDAADVDATVIRRWLKKAESDVLDSKALVRKLREGK